MAKIATKQKLTLINNDCRNKNYSLLSTKYHHCDHNCFVFDPIEL